MSLHEYWIKNEIAVLEQMTGDRVKQESNLQLS
jgi:hypothetical protein